MKKEKLEVIFNNFINKKYKYYVIEPRVNPEIIPIKIDYRYDCIRVWFSSTKRLKLVMEFNSTNVDNISFFGTLDAANAHIKAYIEDKIVEEYSRFSHSKKKEEFAVWTGLLFMFNDDLLNKYNIKLEPYLEEFKRNSISKNLKDKALKKEAEIKALLKEENKLWN